MLTKEECEEIDDLTNEGLRPYEIANKLNANYDEVYRHMHRQKRKGEKVAITGVLVLNTVDEYHKDDWFSMERFGYEIRFGNVPDSTQVLITGRKASHVATVVDGMLCRDDGFHLHVYETLYRWYENDGFKNASHNVPDCWACISASGRLGIAEAARASDS